MKTNTLLLVQLRWLAIVFQFLALAGAIFLKLPVNIGLFLCSLSLQLLLNLYTHLIFSKNRNESEWPILVQLCFDLLFLNVFMVATGGVSNPFSGLFLIQGVVASILLSGSRLVIVLLATALSYAVLLLGFNPSCHEHSLWMKFHIEGMVINHVLSTAVIGYFVYNLVHNLKRKEQQLSAQKNLSCAGAAAAQIAHKIGTPLNRMALIIPDITLESLSQDKKNLELDLSKCKLFLTQFFDQLNRLDAKQTTVTFSSVLEQFKQYSQLKWPSFSIDIRMETDRVINSSSAEMLALIIEILAENAFEASAKLFSVSVKQKSGNLSVLLCNDGQVLDNDLNQLMTLGFSGKGFPHTGIGLFLARLALENLGANLTVCHDTSVCFEILVPLESL